MQTVQVFCPKCGKRHIKVVRDHQKEVQYKCCKRKITAKRP